MPKVSQEEIIRRFREAHGDRYDYSQVEYRNQHTPVTIICPVHGAFQQRPNHHQRGIGCPKCARERVREKARRPRLTLRKFLARAKELFGDKYRYDALTFRGAKAPMRMFCPVHGEFWVEPERHLAGLGCWKCNDIQPVNSPTEEATST